MIKVSLGQVVMTRGVRELLSESIIGFDDVNQCVNRHHKGDWGELCKEDKKANDEACNDKYPERVLSSYKISGIQLWLITEWDRSVTTILLPSEY